MKARILQRTVLLWVGALLLSPLMSSARANHVVLHGGPFLGVVLSIAVDPVRRDNLYVAAYGGGVFRSEDGGSSWVAINRGLPDRKVFALLLPAASPRELYVGTDSGVFHTADRGESWLPAAPELRDRNVRSLLADPTDPGGLFVGTDEGVFHGSQGKWQNLTEGLTSLDVRALVSSPRGEIFAATFGGVFKKRKGARSWTAVNKGLEDRHVRALVWGPLGIVYAGTARGGVFKSLDGGEHWKPANTGLLNSTVLCLLATSGAHGALYACTIDGVFKSVNEGTTWFPTGEELAFTVPTLSSHPHKPDLLYAGSGGWFFRSFNGGEKWERVSPQVDYFGNKVAESFSKEGR